MHMKAARTLCRLGAYAVASLATLLAPASAQPRATRAVDLELVFAIDVSASIDAAEASLQRAGYVAALTTKRVIDTISAGPLGRIAVTYVEWAGGQTTVVDWTVIDGEASARAFADAVLAAPLSTGTTTSISGAIDYAAYLLDENDIEGTRRVIDISSDGRNSRGRPLVAARHDAIERGITINALPILRRDETGRIVNAGLDAYYANNVIGGPGAFIVKAEGIEAFPEAILNKLIIEIADRGTPAAPRLAQR